MNGDILDVLKARIKAMPYRIESLGGQDTKYIQMEEVIGEIEEIKRWQSRILNMITEVIA